MESLLKSLERLALTDDVKERLRQAIREMAPEPSADTPTLKSRLALLRTFTAASYRIAAQKLTVPNFEDFVASSDIEPLIDYKGRYSLSAGVRSQHLNDWLTRVPERVLWVSKLVEALDLADPIDSFERIQLLFLGDQTEARRVLLKAFEVADKQNNIAQCNGLLALVDAVRVFLDPQSTATVNQIRGRAQARNLFFTEFYQSERYFPRQIDTLISQFACGTDEQWICHIYAPGGMGKTTMLRRLLSHQWIVGKQHIPCALLDFDYLDVSAVLQQPGLLGLAMAAQWNEQLEQPLFGGILAPNATLAPLLFRSRRDASARGLNSAALEQKSRTQYLAGLSNPMRCGILAGASPPRTIEDRRKLLDGAGTLLSSWADKLPESIARMPADRPVLLILDTLEDASHSNGQQLLATLKLLADLRRSAREFCRSNGLPLVNLRLILSGRYQLGREHVPEFAQEFSGQYRDCPLPGLADNEATQFLDKMTRRNIGRRAELLAAMTTKSQGIPFNLALFAEWANDPDEQLTPEIVRSSEEISTVMLIERTIKRIQYQPLRWIIRYGVVPRFLSLDFLREVMRQPLLDALSGTASASGSDKPDSETEQDIWNAEPGFHFDPDKLWNDHVRPYIAERNWIGPGDHPLQARFRSDTLQPMRILLRRQRIFATLHALSRDWFGNQPGEPGKWNPAALEVLYHRLQLRGIEGQPPTNLLPAIRELLNDPTLCVQPRLLADVCEDLRGPDFSDLTSSERAYVCYRLADAKAALRDYYFSAPEVLQTLAQALDLAGESRDKVLPPFARVWQLALDGNVSLSTLLAATKNLPIDDMVNAVLLLAEKFLGSTLVEDMLRNVANVVLKRRDRQVPGGVIAARLAGYIRDQDPEGACFYFEAAAQAFLARNDGDRCNEMRVHAATIELSLGRTGRARHLLTQRPNQTAEAELLLARIELARGNASVALLVLRNSKSIPVGVDKHEIIAEAYSQQMELKAAADAWRRATEAADDQRDTAALMRIATGQAKLYYWRMRASPESTPDAVQSGLRRTHSNLAIADGLTNELEVWQIIYGRPGVGRWSRRASGELSGNTPAASIRLIFALSQVITPFPTKRWSELVAFADKLPKTARIAALAEPVLAGEPPELPADLKEEIAQTFGGTEPEDEVDRAWYGVRYGELLAWLGLHDQAVALLAQCVPTLDDKAWGTGWRAAVYRQRRRIEQRIRNWRARTDSGTLYPSPDPDRAELWWRFWQHTPFRAAAALVENAERASIAKNIPLMRECLQMAQNGLQQVKLDTAFHALSNQLSQAAPTARTAPQFETAGVALTGQVVPTNVQSNALEQAFHIASSGPVKIATDVDFDAVQMATQHGRILITRSNASAPQLVSAGNVTLELLLRSRGIPRRLAGVSLGSIVEDLSEFLMDAGITGAIGRTGLQIELSPLSCAPWELASINGPPLFRLPSEWSASQEHWEAPNLGSFGKLETVLFAPISTQDRESPALQPYLTLNLRIPETFTPSTPTSARVLYVACSFIEIPNVNEPAMAEPTWTATTLAATIRSAFQNTQPFVILDVPIPVTSADFTHQLLMRNYFAQVLVDSGAVSGVLATGLHPLAAIGEQQHWLIERISDASTIKIELYDALVKRGEKLQLGKHDALFTAGPNGLLWRTNYYG